MSDSNLYSNFTDSNSEKKRQTVLVFSIIIGLTLFVYLARIFSMQIIEGNEYRIQSELISSKVKVIPAQRGEIYDRNAIVPIATNNDSWAVDITPAEIPSERYDSVLARLAVFLDMPKSEIDAKITPAMRNAFTETEIKSSVPFSVVTDIAENIVDLPGVSWRAKPVRSYASTNSMSHIVGYVGDITREELQVLYNQGYSNTSIIGKTGIERQYDQLLQGKSGTESRTVDVRGRFVSDDPIVTAPQSGDNLILTIDARIQELTEKALGDRVGSAIVLNPRTGEIISMVSYPYFDPNIFSSDNYTSEYNKLLLDEHNPFLNRAVNAEYPVASTFKTIMATAIIAEGEVPMNKAIECEGVLEYGGRDFNCHVGVPGHGHETLQDALADSCNVYFWTAGRDFLGVEKIIEYSEIFGYGYPLNIDLPSSKAGFVPTPEWKERSFHEKWLGGDTMNLSIGQGYTTVTPLHVANSMAMIVNEGVIFEPHVLKEVRDSITGEAITTNTPTILHTADIAESTWDTLKQYLRYTVTNGSAQFPLNNRLVQIAGKTGTAEVSGFTDSWHSWFVSYGFPFEGSEEDALVVCVMVEAVNDWEWWAPYATNIIYQGIFANQTFDEAIGALGFRYLQKPTGRQE